MMGSYFSTTVDMMNILFKGWNTNSVHDVAIATVLTFALTFLYEGLKVLKAYLVIRREQNPLTYGTTDSVTSVDINQSQTELLSSLRIPVNLKQIRHRKFLLFSVESTLNLFNFIYAYFLMLLVMTYSVWLLLAVVIGSGVGYFFFHPLISIFIDKYSLTVATPGSSGEARSSQCCSRPPGQTATGRVPVSLKQEDEDEVSLLDDEVSPSVIGAVV